MAEVEKIWIQHDIDENGFLDFDELSVYLKKTAYPFLNMSDIQLKSIFDHIDKNHDGAIDK